jgi:hypothetical protein
MCTFHLYSTHFFTTNSYIVIMKNNTISTALEHLNWRPQGKTHLIGGGQDTHIAVSMKDLVRTIELKCGPDAAYSILQELGINYDPGMRQGRTQTWDEYYRQSIATAPKDGTIILGYWEANRQQVQVQYLPEVGWCTVDDKSPVPCLTPSHWSPINQ